MPEKLVSSQVLVKTDGVVLEGMLDIPLQAQGVVLFAHGSGSSRFSPRNGFVASVLREHNLATVLIDLLSQQEDESYETRFDIELLTQRLHSVAEWVRTEDRIRDLPLGLFGASTGAASALRLAAWLKHGIYAVVCRGGRPDLAEDCLNQVTAPTLLIVGGNDELVLELNRNALGRVRAEKQLVVISGATHLFEEPGALQAVAEEATKWFTKYLLAVSEPGRTLRAK